MEFLEIIKKNYEENEHLHLLVKFNSFVMGIVINNELFILTYKDKQCFITTNCTDKQIPTVHLNRETIDGICHGIILTKLIEEQKVIFHGSLRDKLLIESLLYLSINNFLDKKEVVA